MKAPSLILIWTAAILSLPVCSWAQSSSTHTIQKGETLFSIAKAYDVEVQQLKRWNDITSDQLSVGQSISVSGEISDTASSGPDNEHRVHTVESGETLFSVSKQYQVTIAELKAWNDLSVNNLKVGQTLTIYPTEQVDQQDQTVTVNNETQQNSTYLVKNNDSLYKIAQKHGMSVDRLKELNNLASNTIRVGQQLTVRSSPGTPSVGSSAASSPQGKFIAYKVREGTTSVTELINKFEMDEEEFKALNTNIQSDRLRNGQEVTVLTPPAKTFKNPYVKNSSSLNSLGTVTVSRYDSSYKTAPTTSGDLYNPEALTGAHSNIALGSVIFVKNPDHPHGVFVRINDRISGNGLKLSAAAWNTLQFSGSGATAMIYQE